MLQLGLICTGEMHPSGNKHKDPAVAEARLAPVVYPRNLTSHAMDFPGWFYPKQSRKPATVYALGMHLGWGGASQPGSAFIFCAIWVVVNCNFHKCKVSNSPKQAEQEVCSVGMWLV